MPNGLDISMIMRNNNEFIIPDNDTEIIANDRLIIMSKAERIKQAEKIFSDKFKYF